MQIAMEIIFLPEFPDFCRKKLRQKVLCNGAHAGITQGRDSESDPCMRSLQVNNTNVHSKFTLISLFSKIHSFLFRE